METATHKWEGRPMSTRWAPYGCGEMGLGCLHIQWVEWHCQCAMVNWPHGYRCGLQLGVLLWVKGGCKLAYCECHCPKAIAKGGNGYRLVSKLGCCYGDWGWKQTYVECPCTMAIANGPHWL